MVFLYELPINVTKKGVIFPLNELFEKKYLPREL